MESMAASIKEKAIQLGYSACGIIPAVAFEEYYEALDKRILSFPNSKEFYESQYSRATPPENARSIVVCIRGYNQYKIPANLDRYIGKYYLFHGNIPYSTAFSAKAELDTYLQLLGIRTVKCYPPPMRWAAVKAGLGKFGRNNFVYTPEHGSYVHIDTWVVDTELDCDSLRDSPITKKCPTSCKKCINACPTKALADEFSMDRGKCITHLMYEKESLPEEIREQMGLWLYGCDVCQDICPMNKDKLTGTEEFPLLLQFEKYMELDKIATMKEETYKNIIYPRFWFAGKDALVTWQCNALRAMINTKDERYQQLIQESCFHQDQRVRRIAKWGYKGNANS